MSSTSWAPPLDRFITLRAGSLSLRTAIDRVAATARLRVSYSAELLPLAREVCVEAKQVTVGALLSELLEGTGVAAVGLGDDQVVLAPRPAALSSAAPAPAPMSNTLGVLDRVVVTGSAVGAEPERDLTVGVDVLDGRQLARANTEDLAGALDSYVPGMWAWTQSPVSMLSSYASIRGASSFGLSYPKIYIDGIEVANPLLVSRFDPSSIDRIEVIRGPQGSALYGTDAISGVVNIVTRHEGANGDGSIASIRSTAGFSQSGYARNALAQDHELTLITGTATRSADLHVSGGTMGAFIPNAFSRNLMANGSAQLVGSTMSLSTTARYFMQQAGTPTSPLIAPPQLVDTSHGTALGAPGTAPSVSRASTTANAPQSVSEYTLGATLTSAPDDRWTHSLVAGIDGYRLANAQTDYTPIPSLADAALRAAEGNADRATVRASSVLRLGTADATQATFTFSAEHATLRASTTDEIPTVTIVGSSHGRSVMALRAQRSLRPNPDAQPFAPRDASLVTSWENSTGLTAQTNLAWKNALYATAGLRLEHDSQLAVNNMFVPLPMLGLAAVRNVGPFTVKLRTAYGEGIRSPSTLSRVQLWQVHDDALTPAPLGPERQAGIESGLDVYLNTALDVKLTHFDQRASGLIQQVGIPFDSGPVRRMAYVAENVGEIANKGWELQATSRISRLALTGSYSTVDSRVERLAGGYSGDLTIGDRMLQVPARTASMNVSWTANRWFASLSGTRAFDWINYDELALAEAYMGTSRMRDLTGPRLRAYWRDYDGALRLRATATRDIRDGFAIELSADNLLNYQRGEPDNITITPGRTIMTGVRIKF